jgi:hypothetical protein
VRGSTPDEGCRRIRHRPETGTPLKNRETGERLADAPDVRVQVDAAGGYLGVSLYEETDGELL